MSKVEIQRPNKRGSIHQWDFVIRASFVIWISAFVISFLYFTRSSHSFSTQPTLASERGEQFSGMSLVVCQ